MVQLLIYNIRVRRFWGGFVMKKNAMIGLIFILVGIFLLLQKLIGIDTNVWNFIWPLFLLIPGILLHIKYFTEIHNSNNYIFPGVLVTYGILFLINNMTNGVYSNYLNAGYPLGIGIGFIENYTFGQRKRSDLSIATIFLIISLYMFVKSAFPDATNLREYVLPGILILIGIFIIAKDKK